MYNSSVGKQKFNDESFFGILKAVLHVAKQLSSFPKQVVIMCRTPILILQDLLLK
jgi:hypothetical protein